MNNEQEITYRDGYDVELPSGKYVHVELLWRLEIGDDYEAGDYDTPPSGGPYAHEVDVEVYKVEEYTDAGEIGRVQLFDFDTNAAKIEDFQQVVDPHWCPHRLVDLVEMLHHQSFEQVEEAHWEAAARSGVRRCN